MPQDFASRHIGASDNDRKHMLDALGFESLEAFTDAIIPQAIRREKPLAIGAALSEEEALALLKSHAQKNAPFRSLIGQGYYGTYLPSVIARNVFENPAWYTSYTPYQPEISQGRLEALLNFQTMIADLTGLEVANASLLDEATAAAEAMTLAQRQSKVKSARFLIDVQLHPQTRSVLETRAARLDIELVPYALRQGLPEGEFFGALVQYPDTEGALTHWQQLADELHARGAVLAVAADLLALTLFTPPGEWGSDIAVGSAQRFGVPMGFGGPHAGYMATRDAFKRSMPGRLVGVSIDSHGQKAYRLALQTREQHIRREKATSNICTAQALLAILASCYAVYHGPEGLRAIARRIHNDAQNLAQSLKDAGYKLRHTAFFDTLTLTLPDAQQRDALLRRAAEQKINLRALGDTELALSLDECTDAAELAQLRAIFGLKPAENTDFSARDFERESAFLTHPVFHRYRSETQMMRYLRTLADKDLALDRTMIPLGSCTMKLNAASEMLPISWPEFANVHPFAPAEQNQGWQAVFAELETMIADATGYAAVSFQPNSGANGEYAGLLAIMAYHQSRGEHGRKICLIPASAHGTNPASASLAGLKVVVVACNERGDVDLEDLRQKVAQYGEQIAAIMITYPSTHGVFEHQVREVCDLVHSVGGQVYIDGANFNALLGLAAPGAFGGDVSHLNLHKTFAIPHGGGGPGVGPIGVREHLAPFLPGHVQLSRQEGAVAAAPFGSALVCLISWMYLKMMGSEGLRTASQMAILNANYIAHRLRDAYAVLYSDAQGHVAHECILDTRPFKAWASVDDIAKRLMDFGFHAPTMSFPVPGTLMIEPTESEALDELERFCAAMRTIREEIAQVERGDYPKDDNPLVNAPHTLADLLGEWSHPYSRAQAVYPAGHTGLKYFTPVNRIDNAWGDRNLQCSCPSIESYQD